MKLMKKEMESTEQGLESMKVEMKLMKMKKLKL